MVSVPTVNLALTGANIVSLRKAAGLTVHDLQAASGFILAALLHVHIDDILVVDHSVA